MCELLLKLVTFWLEATRGLWEAFCRDSGPLQTSGFPICELLLKLADFWLRATRGLLEAFFRDLGQAASQSVSCEV